MQNQNYFTPSAQNYLSRFYSILDTMMQEMTSAPLTQSISHNFIVQMLPHHRAAIEMSHNILAYSTYVPLRDIALQIISEQTKSIENMMNVLNSCSLVRNSEKDLVTYQSQVNRIMQTMFTGMKQAPATNDLNRDFIYEMIPHHRGAVEMSKNALEYPICPSLRPILQAIVTSQEEGIRQMEEILRQLS